MLFMSLEITMKFRGVTVKWVWGKFTLTDKVILEINDKKT